MSPNAIYRRMSYILHYAPDNASLAVRLALEQRGLPYKAVLVDRKQAEQSGPAYRQLNPNGLIPVLETPQGPLFETGAILLWLADTHGQLGPAPDAPERGDFLKWLFFVANTLHPAERMLFYPEKFIAPDHATALRAGLTQHLHQSFTTLDAAAALRPDWLGGTAPTVLDFYVAALLRWPALYPADHDRSWFRLGVYPALQRVCAKIESLPATIALQQAEGLGDTPFTAPRHPNPPIGSAT
ncbi:glutathione S-transferase [Sulfitobacter brevis]|uniref:Glutathione S-transferase n=2 Tax=Sulfitobacter brevis TaxID=74348 RepID=A0A1I1Z086_9RHOB|nr:glutathione S-transferase [Sulfitobacter brevis]